MAHSQTVRNAVRDAYLAGIPLALAAEQAGVSEATARIWKKAATGANDWDRLRAARSLVVGGHDGTVQQILGEFLQLHGETIREIKESGSPAGERVQALASLTDSLSKTMAALGKAAPKLSELGIALEVVRMLGDHIQEKNPKLIPAFVGILDSFGERLGKKYG